MKKYIKSDLEISSAMESMIERTVAEFHKSMEFQECATFREFCQLNDFEASDIRSEIRYIIQHYCDGWMYDDGTIVVASDDSEMPYRAFKKAVVDGLKST